MCTANEKIKSIYKQLNNLHNESKQESETFDFKYNDILELTYSYRLRGSMSQLTLLYRLVGLNEKNSNITDIKISEQSLHQFAVDDILEKHICRIFSTEVKFTNYQFSHYRNINLIHKEERRSVAGVYGQVRVPAPEDPDTKFVFELKLKSSKTEDKNKWSKNLKVKGVPYMFETWDDPGQNDSELLDCLLQFSGCFKVLDMGQHQWICTGVNKGSKAEINSEDKNLFPFIFSIIPQGFEKPKVGE